jgi:hypothetical protein
MATQGNLAVRHGMRALCVNIIASMVEHVRTDLKQASVGFGSVHFG